MQPDSGASDTSGRQSRKHSQEYSCALFPIHISPFPSPMTTPESGSVLLRYNWDFLQEVT
jgi:hypothetical protein